jgi:hypothetical protein
MKYRKKPVVIEAVQYGPHYAPSAELNLFLEGSGAKFTEEGIVIPTLEGDHLARIGDYIIKGVKGEFYPCKPDIFHMTYEAADIAEGPLRGTLDHVLQERDATFALMLARAEAAEAEAARQRTALECALGALAEASEHIATSPVSIRRNRKLMIDAAYDVVRDAFYRVEPHDPR